MTEPPSRSGWETPVATAQSDGASASSDSLDASSDSLDQRQDRRLGRLLAWVAAFAFVAAAFEFIMGLTFDSWRLHVGAGIAGLAGVLFLGAARNMHQGQEVPGAVLLTLGIYAGALAYTFVLPGAISALALLPVLIVAVLLPFLRGAALMRVLMGSWVAGLALVVFNLLWNPALQLPAWFATTFRAIAFAMVLALTLSLLFHHHSRLRSAIEKAQADADALREAHEQLQESSRVKTRFLNSAAHELRTPLTPVLIQLELMRHSPLLQQDAPLRHSTQMIERNVLRLKSHVDELLDIARLQSGKFPLRRKDVVLDTLLTDVLESFQEPAKREHITLDVQRNSRIVVQADDSRVLQVLFNLVSNAVKATPAGGRIEIAADVHDGRCTIHVKDNGKGLHDEDIPKLFEPFGQVQNDDEPGNGAGLGLYISRRIVEAHGGRIGVTSDGPGNGSDFHFTLPDARIEPTDRGPRPRLHVKARRTTHGVPLDRERPPATQTP